VTGQGIEAKTTVDIWQESRQRWAEWGTLDLFVGDAAELPELVRVAFTIMATKSAALPGFYRVGGRRLVLQWIDADATIVMEGGGPRELTCGQCMATNTTSKARGETINCAECGYAVTVA